MVSHLAAISASRSAPDMGSKWLLIEHVLVVN